MHLITPTLHAQFYWWLKMDKPKQEILDFLNKVPVPKNEAMQRGIDFEDNIFAYQNGTFEQGDYPDAYVDCVREIAEITSGGIWQSKLDKKITLNGQPYLLYGKSDVIKRDWIYDVKFSKSYDIGKYTPALQHWIYMYLTGLEKFAYLVSDGKSVFREEYFWEEDSEQKLLQELKELTDRIMSDAEFKEAYLTHWKSKY